MHRDLSTPLLSHLTCAAAAMDSVGPYFSSQEAVRGYRSEEQVGRDSLIRAMGVNKGRKEKRAEV